MAITKMTDIIVATVLCAAVLLLSPVRSNGRTAASLENDILQPQISQNVTSGLPGYIVGWGWNGEGEVNVPAGNNYVVIAANGWHNLALKSDGSMVGAGGPTSTARSRPPPAMISWPSQLATTSQSLCQNTPRGSRVSCPRQASPASRRRSAVAAFQRPTCRTRFISRPASCPIS